MESAMTSETPMEILMVSTTKRSLKMQSRDTKGPQPEAEQGLLGWQLPYEGT